MSEPRKETHEARPQAGPPRIRAGELLRRMQWNEPITIIDTRSPEAWGKSDRKIRGAVRMTVGEIEEQLDRIPNDRPVVTYCT